MNVVANTFGLSYRDGCHVVSEQCSGDTAGANATKIISTKCRRRVRPQPADDVDDLFPIQPHHREDRSELDHDGEHAAGIVEPQQRAPMSRCAVDETGRNSVSP
jgi:hypothetical protein